MHSDERRRRARDRLLEVAVPDPTRTGDDARPAVRDVVVEGGDDVEDLPRSRMRNVPSISGQRNGRARLESMTADAFSPATPNPNRE